MCFASVKGIFYAIKITEECFCGKIELAQFNTREAYSCSKYEEVLLDKYDMLYNLLAQESDSFKRAVKGDKNLAKVSVKLMDAAKTVIPPSENQNIE